MHNKGDYKLLHHDDKSYTVQKKDGKHFKVIKAGLSKEVREKMHKYFGGGLVEGYDVGGGPDANGEPVEPTQEAQQIQQGANSDLLDQARNLPPSDAQVAQPAAQPPEPPPVPEDQKPGLEQLGNYDAPTAKALQSEKEAGQEMGRAQAQETKEVGVHSGNTAQKLLDYQTNVINKSNEKWAARADDTYKALASGKITVPDLFHDMSTGQKVMTGIGMLLAGFGSSSSGGRNMVVDQLERNIERDMKAQQLNIENKDNLFNKILAQEGDERAAQLQYTNTMMAVAKYQADAIAARSADPKMAAANQMFAAQIDQKAAQGLMAYKVLNAKRAFEQGPFPVEAASSPILEKDRGRIVRLPGGKTAALAGTPQQAADANKVVSNTESVLDSIKELRQLSNDSSTLISGSPGNLKASELSKRTLSQLMQLEGAGRWSPETIKLRRGQLPDPRFPWNQAVGDKKLKALEEGLTNDMHNKLQSVLPSYQSPNKFQTDKVGYARK